MALTGYSGKISEFIEFSESNELAGIIRDTISPNMKSTNPEFGSWRDGLLKLSMDLSFCIKRDENIGDLDIVVELVFDDGKRVDVIICGNDENGKNLYLILELKQWSKSTISESEEPGKLLAQVGNAHVSEVYHPLIQAQAYSDSLASNPVFADSNFLSGAYLPNMLPNRIINYTLESKPHNNLILNNQEVNLFDLLNSNFSLSNICSSSLEIIKNNVFEFSSDYDFIKDDSLEDEIDGSEIHIPEQQRGRYGYLATKDEFIEDCERNLIAAKIRERLGIRMRETTSEYRSWNDGLLRLAILLRKVDCNLAVACEVSSQAGMIDVILMGRSQESIHIFVLEIKQWSEPGIFEAHGGEYIRAHVGGGNIRLTLHPLFQAHRYLRGLVNYNMYFEENNPSIECVAFLPNVLTPDDSEISDPRFTVEEGQIVFGSTSNEFIDLLNEVLVDSVSTEELKTMIESPPGFTSAIIEQIRTMIEDPSNSLVPSGEQQRAIDKIVNNIAMDDCKQVHIIQGGPGTGKTIVGLLTLFSLREQGKSFFFIAGNNPTPRVLRKRVRDIVGNNDFDGIIMTGGQLKNFIKKHQIEQLDLLLVDEAQSLKWGMGAPPKIDEMIDKSKILIFMLDERQSDDPRESVNIERILVEVENAKTRLNQDIRVTNHNLEIQQRAGAISNLLPWIGKLLGFPDETTAPLNFPVTVHESANELRKAVLEQNSEDGVEGALTASYCWGFISKDGADVYDIELDDGDFQARWNQQGGTGDVAFVIDDTRDERVGYPPELRGQELNHAGVILGPDLKIVDGQLVIFPENQAYDSHCFKIPGRGNTPKEKIAYQREKKGEYLNQDREKYVSLVRNQYWIILTRASEHLHLYSEDEEVRNFIKEYFDTARGE